MFYLLFFLFFFFLPLLSYFLFFVFFFNDTATTEIYTLSLHDALPISPTAPWCRSGWTARCARSTRSEEHTSELQSRRDLVCRLLLEKKKKKRKKQKRKKKKTKKIKKKQKQKTK